MLINKRENVKEITSLIHGFMKVKFLKLEYDLFDWESDVLIKEENYSYRFQKDISLLITTWLR